MVVVVVVVVVGSGGGVFCYLFRVSPIVRPTGQCVYSVFLVCFWYVFNTVSAWFACMSVISKWRFGEAFIHVR